MVHLLLKATDPTTLEDQRLKNTTNNPIVDKRPKNTTNNSIVDRSLGILTQPKDRSITTDQHRMLSHKLALPTQRPPLRAVHISIDWATEFLIVWAFLSRLPEQIIGSIGSTETRGPEKITNFGGPCRREWALRLLLTLKTMCLEICLFNFCCQEVTQMVSFDGGHRCVCVSNNLIDYPLSGWQSKPQTPRR